MILMIENPLIDEKSQPAGAPAFFRKLRRDMQLEQKLFVVE